jgi:hypothetical protein
MANETTKPIHAMTKAELTDFSNKLAKATEEALPPKTGFFLLLFEFGGPSDVQYISNAERRSMLRAIKNVYDRLRMEKPPKEKP